MRPARSNRPAADHRRMAAHKLAQAQSAAEAAAGSKGNARLAALLTAHQTATVAATEAKDGDDMPTFQTAASVVQTAADAIAGKKRIKANPPEVAVGVHEQRDGTWLAVTWARSHTLKTEAGAVRWFWHTLGEKPKVYRLSAAEKKEHSDYMASRAKSNPPKAAHREQGKLDLANALRQDANAHKREAEGDRRSAMGAHGRAMIAAGLARREAEHASDPALYAQAQKLYREHAEALAEGGAKVKPNSPTDIRHVREGLLARMHKDGANRFADKVRWVKRHMPNITEPKRFVAWVVAQEYHKSRPATVEAPSKRTDGKHASRKAAWANRKGQTPVTIDAKANAAGRKKGEPAYKVTVTQKAEKGVATERQAEAVSAAVHKILPSASINVRYYPKLIGAPEADKPKSSGRRALPRG